MILSDSNVLASLFTSLLTSSSESLLVQNAVGKRLAIDPISVSQFKVYAT